MNRSKKISKCLASLFLLVLLAAPAFTQTDPIAPPYILTIVVKNYLGAPGNATIYLNQSGNETTGHISNVATFPFGHGAVVTLTDRSPAPACICPYQIFNSWIGDVNGNTVTMDASKTIIAQYGMATPFTTVWFSPTITNVTKNGTFSTKLTVNANNPTSVTQIGYFDVTVSYNNARISVDKSKGTNGVTALNSGLLISVDNTIPGTLHIIGVLLGYGSPAFDLARIDWNAIAGGTASLGLKVTSLNDSNGKSLATGDYIMGPWGLPGIVNISDGFQMGDVNGDGKIDIVDALLVARYYIGYSDPGFNDLLADVNNDSIINIVDALKIAQHYIGVIPGF